MCGCRIYKLQLDKWIYIPPSYSDVMPGLVAGVIRPGGLRHRTKASVTPIRVHIPRRVT